MTQPSSHAPYGKAADRAGDDWRLGAWDTAPMLLDAIAADGTVLACNATHAAALGYGVDEVIGQPAERFYLRGSTARLRELLELLHPGAVQRHLHLDLRCRDGRPLHVAASVDTLSHGGGKVLRLAKMPVDPALDGAAQLARENETLHSIVSTSKDALWCIEFAEPVDLTAPLPEAVRQVFENVSYWRLCNKAMARLYKLPETLDFNEQHVRVAFPRNPENEAFAQQLIEHDFNIDGAPSLDRRYDGRDVYVENDVRGHVENGMLHRMWGAARDLSEQRRKELDLTNRLDATLEVLSALPDPILVIGQDGVLEAANPAIEWRFGWPIDEVLGRAATKLVRFPQGFDPAADTLTPGGVSQTLAVVVLAADGSENPCRAHLSALRGNARGGPRIVLTLRPEDGRGADGSRRRRPAASPVG
jgi:PAS domain S-box-containing protein